MLFSSNQTLKYCFPAQITFSVVGVPDKNGIQKENWYTTPERVRLVFSELNKISRYFADKVQVLAKIS